MKLNGRRESSNVDDRRGQKIAAGGIGLAGIVLIAVFTLMKGGNLGDVLQQVAETQLQPGVEQSSTPVDTSETDELAHFSKQILAGTEDVWTKLFQEYGLGEYKPPRLVLFTDRVQSGCGGATSQTGPFYCSVDQAVYIDLMFFKTMRQTIGADGDFAYAYVIAHEVGHHVQYLLGTLQQAHQQMSRVSERESNQISVRLELQADFYAGVWANNDNRMFRSLEEGDIDEGMAVASKIGDDYLQKKAYGRTIPDSFNHGTSAQRSRWLKKGLSTGDINQGDTFSPAYTSL